MNYDTWKELPYVAQGEWESSVETYVEAHWDELCDAVYTELLAGDGWTEEEAEQESGITRSNVGEKLYDRIEEKAIAALEGR